jgi:hypothetical protein
MTEFKNLVQKGTTGELAWYNWIITAFFQNYQYSQIKSGTNPILPTDRR